MRTDATKMSRLRRWGTAALGRGAALLLWLLTASAGAGQFAVNYSPTGIAYDAVSNRVCVSSGGGVNIYDTNGVLQSAFSSGSPFDLGAGTGGNVWIASGHQANIYTLTGDNMS